MTAKEKLIAKLQIEYARVAKAEGGIFYTNYDLSDMEWDVGLLYMTTMNLWFVNTKQEKTKVPIDSVVFISEIYPVEGKRTKFSNVMGATHIFHISYTIPTENKGTLVESVSPIYAQIYLTAQRSVLEALRAQLKIRASKHYRRYYEKWKNRKLSALLYLGIREEARLAYFLQMSTEDLLNIILKRSSGGR